MIKYKRFIIKITIDLEYIKDAFGIKYENKSYVIIRSKINIKSKKKLLINRLKKI